VNNTDSVPLGLGRLPMLDIMSIFMFLLGLYYYERRLSMRRSKTLFGGLLVGLFVTSLTGFSVYKLSILLPIIYIFIAGGVNEVITRWLSVFPRNPVARSFGIGILAVSIGFLANYHLMRYFVARPGNPAIIEHYTEVHSGTIEQ